MLNVGVVVRDAKTKEDEVVFKVPDKGGLGGL